jgi:hypothetical protein
MIISLLFFFFYLFLFLLLFLISFSDWISVITDSDWQELELFCNANNVSILKFTLKGL